MYQVAAHGRSSAPKGDPVRDPDPHLGRCIGSRKERLSRRTGSTRKKKTGKDKARRVAAVAAPAHRDPAGHQGPRREFPRQAVARRPLPRRSLRLSRPRGDVKALARRCDRRSTFAFAVHTKVGEHCVGAKVNGKLVPPAYGRCDRATIVEIRDPRPQPAPEPADWLKFVKSTRPRAPRSTSGSRSRRAARALDRART